MTTTLSNPKTSAWLNRWTKPALDALLDPLKAHHRRQFSNIIDKLNGLARTQQSVFWYGASWRWTIAFCVEPEKSAGSNTRNKPSRQIVPTAVQPLCYLVPNHEVPAVCVPLTDVEVERLLEGQLTRFIREGVLSAKSAVSIRWATWTPTTESETIQIVDLLKKKHALSAGVPMGKPGNN